MPWNFTPSVRPSASVSGPTRNFLLSACVGSKVNFGNVQQQFYSWNCGCPLCAKFALLSHFTSETEQRISIAMLSTPLDNLYPSLPLPLVSNLLHAIYLCARIVLNLNIPLLLLISCSL